MTYKVNMLHIPDYFTLYNLWDILSNMEIVRGHEMNNLQPTNDWIWSSFGETVRLNSQGDLARQYPRQRELADCNISPSFDLEQLSCPPIAPNRGFYQELVNHHGLENTPFDVPSQILTVLLNKTFRVGELSLLAGSYMNTLRERIRSVTQNNEPIELVMLTLPFKDQNPLTTQHSLSFTDLGEDVFLSRLGILADSVRRIYSPGLRTNIVCDGVAYADIFADNNTAGGHAYRNNCERLIDQMGYSSSIQLFDLAEIIHQDQGFGQVRKNIRNRIETSFNTNPETYALFSSLRRGMMFNMRPHSHDSYEQFSLIANMNDGEIRNHAPQVMDKIHTAALDYASILLTLKHRQTVARSFPTATRTTARPTIYGRLGLRMTRTGLAVYNGVPVVDQFILQRTGNLLDATYCFRLWELFKQPEVTRVFREDEDEPFYYSVPKVQI